MGAPSSFPFLRELARLGARRLRGIPKGERSDCVLPVPTHSAALPQQRKTGSNVPACRLYLLATLSSIILEI